MAKETEGQTRVMLGETDISNVVLKAMTVHIPGHARGAELTVYVDRYETLEDGTFVIHVGSPTWPKENV